MVCSSGTCDLRGAELFLQCLLSLSSLVPLHFQASELEKSNKPQSVSGFQSQSPPQTLVKVSRMSGPVRVSEESSELSGHTQIYTSLAEEAADGGL